MHSGPTTAKRCQAITKGGKPCEAPALAGSTFCWHHDPARAADRAQARSKGGKARHGRAIRHIMDDAPPAALQTPEDALCVLEHALAVALALEPSYRQVQALVSVALAAVKVHEAGELSQRIMALEQRLGLEGVRGNGGRTPTTFEPA